MRRLLATTTVAAALCSPALLDAGPTGAATPPVDVDQIALGTSRLEFNSELTWSKVVYLGQARDQGFHVPTAIHLAPNSCASIAISWFDGGNSSTPATVMERELGCASVTDVIGLDQLHMSRLNEPPAVKAKVCVTSRPKVGIDRPQTACATAFAFVDRSQGI
ncbi:MAG: hypothetical protein AB7W59_31765 [Acidimicrobiia bacterium]